MKNVQFLLLSAFVLTVINISITVEAAEKYRPNPFYPVALTRAVWQGDNQLFAEAKQRIDQEVERGEAPDMLTIRYKAVAGQESKDPLKVFLWAYASRKAALASNPFSTAIALKALDAMNHNTKPHPYDYVRLQFLLASDVWPASSLEPLGRRLLQYRGDDKSVIVELVADMKNSTALQDRKGAFYLAQNLLRQDPKDPRNHALLAGAYESLWEITHQRTTADKAIAEYQIYLKLAPANDNFRRGAEQMIRAIKNSE